MQRCQNDVMDWEASTLDTLTYFFLIVQLVEWWTPEEERNSDQWLSVALSF